MDIGFVILMIVVAYAFGYVCTYLNAHTTTETTKVQDICDKQREQIPAQQRIEEYCPDPDVENVVLRLSTESLDIVSTTKSTLSMKHEGEVILAMLDFMHKLSEFEHAGGYIVLENGKNKVLTLPEFQKRYIFPTKKVLQLYFRDSHVETLKKLSDRFASPYRDEIITRVIHFFGKLLKIRNGKSVTLLDKKQQQVSMDLA